ncbi:MAG: galactokinase, partial [Flavobacteriales bacterium]
QNHWTDFVLGVILHLQHQGIEIEGCDILFSSTLPKASGLSSSAALEVLCYFLFYHIATGKEPNRVQMALDCQKIENEFIGVACGIMDQFAVANGKANHAISLDCNSLEHDFVPIDLGAYSLLIINSNKPRTLAESAYNQRRQECNEALEIIANSRPIENLVNAKNEDLSLLGGNLLKRTRHAASEHQRVQDSAIALSKNQIKKFGQLMTESHHSLREDFEVSCDELDFIVDFSNQTDGCLGARMTGAGFGGCCIALIETRQSNHFQKQLQEFYLQRFGFAPSVYLASPSSGVHKLPF